MRASFPLLAEALGLEPPEPGNLGRVVAFVGGGGKTSAIYDLARELFEFRIIVTTTTRLRDPRSERDRPIDRVLLRPELAEAASAAPVGDSAGPRRGRGALVLGSRTEAVDRKLIGIHPSRVEEFRADCDFVLVEADGSRGLPIKAPAPWEPVVPDCACLVVGLVGLDCLGAPLGPETAHRPELLGPLIGCVAGESLGIEHLCALASSPGGLFKGAPTGARRAILLNKAELLAPAQLEILMAALARTGSDLVIACSLRDGAGVSGTILSCAGAARTLA